MKWIRSEHALDRVAKHIPDCESLYADGTDILNLLVDHIEKVEEELRKSKGDKALHDLHS